MANNTREFVDDYRRHTTPSGVEQLADIEFAVDVLGGYPDPLLKLGFDPSIARATKEGKYGYYGMYSPGGYPDSLKNIFPERLHRNVDKSVDLEAQADILRHEYRHKALSELRNNYRPQGDPHASAEKLDNFYLDKEIRDVMGDQWPSDATQGLTLWERRSLLGRLEESLARSFDLRYGNRFITEGALDDYYSYASWYPEKKETLTEFMNRVEGKATGLLSRRWDG